MKVIIGKHGSYFSLRSEELIKKAAFTNEVLFVYEYEEWNGLSNTIFKRVNFEEALDKINNNVKKLNYYVSNRDLGNEFNSKSKSKYNDLKQVSNLNLSDYRTDPAIMKLIEEGLIKGLKIVEIPDDVDWYVDLIDVVDWEQVENSMNWDQLNEAIGQAEIIREKHKIWK